jgi:hypothetical protein
VKRIAAIVHQLIEFEQLFVACTKKNAGIDPEVPKAPALWNGTVAKRTVAVRKVTWLKRESMNVLNN